MVSTKEILSIDMGKFNSVFTCFDEDSKKPEFGTVFSSLDLVRLALLRNSGHSRVMVPGSQAGWGPIVFRKMVCKRLGSNFRETIIRPD